MDYSEMRWRSGPAIDCSEKRSQSSPAKSSGSSPSCGTTTFSSWPRVTTSGAPAFGLTQIQSMSAGGVLIDSADFADPGCVPGVCPDVGTVPLSVPTYGVPDGPARLEVTI